MSDGPPFCSQCGGDRGPREPSDSDGLGCLENVYHHEDPLPQKMYFVCTPGASYGPLDRADAETFADGLVDGFDTDVPIWFEEC